MYGALDDYLNDSQGESKLQDIMKAKSTEDVPTVDESDLDNQANMASETKGVSTIPTATVVLSVYDLQEAIECLFPDFDDLLSSCDTCEIDLSSNDKSVGGCVTKVYHGNRFTADTYEGKRQIMLTFLKDL
jgi:hypothetical protein